MSENIVVQSSAPTDLSAAEHERLALVLEEMGECIQIIGKIYRHGYFSKNPLDPSSEINRQLLEKELGDVLTAIHLLTTAGDVDDTALVEHSISKLQRMKQWLHHQPSELIDQALFVFTPR